MVGLIKLIYAKTQLVFHAEQVLNKSLEKTKSSSYIHQVAFVTYVEINEKSSSTLVVMVP